MGKQVLLRAEKRNRLYCCKKQLRQEQLNFYSLINNEVHKVERQLIDFHRRAPGFNFNEVHLGGLHVKFAVNELDFGRHPSNYSKTHKNKQQTI